MSPTDVFVVTFGAGVILFLLALGLVAGFNWLSDYFHDRREVRRILKEQRR